MNTIHDDLVWNACALCAVLVIIGLLTIILIRQEKFKMSIDDQLKQIESNSDTLVADEVTDKAAVAEILTELKASRDAGTPVDPARLDAIIAKLEGVHTNLSADTGDLTAAETPSTPPATS